MAWVVYSGARKMMIRYNPYLSSLEVSIAADKIEKKISDLNQIHYGLLDHKDNYYSMADVKPYLNINMIFQLKTYDDKGKETKKNTEIPLKDCDSSDFTGSEDEKRYF